MAGNRIIGSNLVKYLAVFQYLINILLALFAVILQGGGGLFLFFGIYTSFSVIISYLLLSQNLEKPDQRIEWSRWLAVANSLVLFWLFGPYRLFYFFNIMALYPALVFTGITIRFYLLMAGEIILLFLIHAFSLQASVLLNDGGVLFIHLVSTPFVLMFQSIFKKQKQIVEENAGKVEEKNKIIEYKNIQLFNDLSFAQKIQWNLLPWADPNFKHTSIEFFYKPMQQLGGDFFDFLRMRESHLKGIFISDVSGHGVAAALITIMVKTLIEAAGKARAKPSDLLIYINDKIAGKINDNFLTAFYAIYDEKNKVLTYANAGHNAPWCMRRGEIFELDAKGPILGFRESIHLEEKTFKLQEGDKLFFFTDGLIEATDKDLEPFEEKLKQLIIENQNIPIKQLISLIEYHLTLHCESPEFSDDVCLIGLEIH